MKNSELITRANNYLKISFKAKKTTFKWQSTKYIHYLVFINNIISISHYYHEVLFKYFDRFSPYA